MPALVGIPGLEKPLLQALYESAASFYNCEPWVALSSDYPFCINVDPGIGSRYAVVMGSASSDVTGLALYDYLDVLEDIYLLEPDKATSPGSAVALLYEHDHVLAVADLYALEKFKWPVAGAEAYPMVSRTDPEGKPVHPSLEDVRALVATLSHLPAFIEQHLRAVSGQDGVTEEIYALDPALGGGTVTISAPVPLPRVQAREQAFEREFAEGWSSKWSWDDASRDFAIPLATCLTRFLRSPQMLALSEATHQTHMRNCSFIGFILTRWADGRKFDYMLLQDCPTFEQEFRASVSDAKSAVASYRATWNKLRRFAWYTHIREA